MMRLRTLAALIAVLVVVLSACSDTSDTDAGETTTSDPSSVPTDPVETRVGIENFQFVPGDLTVAVGTTVEWQNRATGTSHTTTADEGAWDSGTIEAGGSFSQTFDAPGTFSYFCAIHPQMTGTITVEG